MLTAPINGEGIELNLLFCFLSSLAISHSSSALQYAIHIEFVASSFSLFSPYKWPGAHHKLVSTMILKMTD